MTIVANRILSGLLALIYLATATLKFMSVSSQVAEFQLFGYPLWFMYVVGTLEAVCAIGLLVPRFATPAALFLACDMIGVASSHLIHHQAKMATLPIALLIILIAVISLRGDLRSILTAKSSA